jgi:hypothetical protein
MPRRLGAFGYFKGLVPIDLIAWVGNGLTPALVPSLVVYRTMMPGIRKACDLLRGGPSQYEPHARGCSWAAWVAFRWERLWRTQMC